jgi:hypothetical protein
MVHSSSEGKHRGLHSSHFYPFFNLCDFSFKLFVFSYFIFNTPACLGHAGFSNAEISADICKWGTLVPCDFIDVFSWFGG